MASQLSRVAVVGGGPAGSFFALYIFHFARELGLAPEVHIYEPKDFGLGGPRGCNRCAGILSPSLVRNMRELGLEMPPEVVQARISIYALQGPYDYMEIENPAGEEICSVYRGSGPLSFPLSPEVSFDAFLLGAAKKAGARVLPHRVTALRLRPRPAVQVGEEWTEYDLVVLAMGVNSPPLSGEDLAYRPPATRRMAQDELRARKEDVQEAFNGRVKVILLPHSDLVFGSLVPKGPFVNVSLLGRRGPPSVEEFLSNPLVRNALPFPYERACGCRPLISVGLACDPAGEGFVAVGDAAATRLYKDGIGSALLTARQAAHTAVHHGTTARAFARNYLPFLQSLHRDNSYGRLLFYIHSRLKESPSFFIAQARLVEQEKSRPGPRPYHRVMWGMFTGSYNYGNILKTTLRPSFVPRLSLQALREKLRGRRLIPRRVLILGGGFGGVYTALHLEKALRRQPVEITLVSRENFFLFTPLLHEVATGGIETRHIAYPIRSLRGRKRFSFIQAEVAAVDLDKKAVQTDRGLLPYDYLVLALGSTTDTRQLPTAAGHVFTLKTINDGIAIRNHLISLFEEADARPGGEGLLTFVVAGGGATGVQLIAEMRDFFFRFLLRNYPGVDPEKVRLILVQNRERLLDDMHPSLAAYALSVLRKKGIEVRLGSKVTRVLPGAVEISGQEVISTSTLVWTAGVRASPVVEALPVEKDSLGRVKVNRYLEVPAFPGVYALGDNALFVNPATGSPLPARAHIAVRQPRVVAHNILADLFGRRKRPCPVPWMSQTVSLGSREAGMELLGLRILGLPARFLWLVSYLLLVPSVYVRTRVLLDWLLALFFGRDTTLIRLR